MCVGKHFGRSLLCKYSTRNTILFGIKRPYLLQNPLLKPENVLKG